MCGLPFSRATPQPAIVAAPVPSPPEFGGAARYWSEFVVRADSRFHTVEDTFGTRIAFSAADSQSGFVAALTYFMSTGGIAPAARAAPADTADIADAAAATHGEPLYREVTAPTITPLGAVTAVIEAAADVAPIDAYALRLIQRYRPELTSQVRIVGRTSPTPIPPLVASGRVAEALRSAFQEAHRDVALRGLMDPLLLQRFVLPEAASYEVLRDGFESATRYWSQHRFADSMPGAFVTNRG
jgi:ABC-type phosphate/phosphonate transport system substrate-binding protein